MSSFAIVSPDRTASQPRSLMIIFVLILFKGHTGNPNTTPVSILLGTSGRQGHVAGVSVVAVGDGRQLARVAAAFGALRSIVRDAVVQFSRWTSHVAGTGRQGLIAEY
jgi:hypothetical protein